MRYSKDVIVLVIVISAATLCRAGSFAYIERWATGTLTTGDPFESWRIHVVVPDGDDWVGSAIDGWLTSGPTWYYDPVAGFIARPDLFDVYPDAEFGTYFTVPEFYPNSDLWGGFGMSADGVFEPTYLHLGAWGGLWSGAAITSSSRGRSSIRFRISTGRLNSRTTLCSSPHTTARS